MMRTTKLVSFLTAAMMGLVGCAADEEILEPEDMDPMAGEDGKFEAWNQANNPAFVDSGFVYYAQQLPVSGAGPKPTPGDYWGHAWDSINKKWDGATSLSPAEKFAKVFGKPGTMEGVSKDYGVKSLPNNKVCTTDADCAGEDDQSICSTSFDGAMKRCVPTWFGICPGWAAYAISEPTPRNPVVRTAPDGTQVTFYPGDLEALMTILYTQTPTKFISSRCNKKDPPTDAQGRPIQGECRDMNPGTWHVIVSNLMGVRKQGFVLDKVFDYEVWNQPGRDYRVTNAVGDKLKEITKAEAIQLLGADETLTSLLATTEVRKDEQKTGSYTAPVQGAYKVKLSGTGDADLYVKKGSAPTLDSFDCRPYEGTSVEECSLTLNAGEVVHWMVSGYGATSNIQVGVATAGGSGSYTYNTAAKKFFHVKMEFRYITESRPARVSHIDQLDQYTVAYPLEYVLEADEYGKIIGGEWVGESRTEHPDFAWWPTGKPTGAQGGGNIKFSEVGPLNTEAAGTPTVDETVKVIDNYTIYVNSSGAWNSKYATVNVEPGFKKLEITMTGTGDADLYVRKGQNPTIYTYTCKSTTVATSAEKCTLDVGADGGRYHVRARTKTPNTTVTVTAKKSR